MKICGLDQSLTSFGLVTATDEFAGRWTINLHRIMPGKLRGDERLDYLMTEVVQRCEGAHLAVVEGLTYGAKGDSLLELAGLLTMTRHTLWTMGVPYAVMNPTLVKMWATGDHQADKIAMVTAAIRRFPDLDIDSHDVADALWLCAAGCEHAGRPLAQMPKDRVAALSAAHTAKAKRGKPKIAWPPIRPANAVPKSWVTMAPTGELAAAGDAALPDGGLW